MAEIVPVGDELDSFGFILVELFLFRRIVSENAEQLPSATCTLYNPAALATYIF